MRITVVICTHNRSALLNKTLHSLWAANNPLGCAVNILIVVNACNDNTVALLKNHINNDHSETACHLTYVEEPRQGKSYALNRAISLINDGVIAFVDDDHRVDINYLVNICSAVKRLPQSDIFCGRILPDWDGSEPAWAHDSGPYAIYPLPVPRYDQGDKVREIGLSGPIPGGGNLIVKKEVFDRIGGFSTAHGPKGHNLSGGEDGELLMRALNAGERIYYIPDIIQYHAVEPERFRLSYLLKKSYQRSLSVMKIHGDQFGMPPPYLLRKLGGYILQAVASMSWAKTRFYMVRIAATLGEIRAYLGAGANDRK